MSSILIQPVNTETAGPPSAAYLQKNLEVADLIHAHDFDLREILVLTFIRRQSLGSGQSQAYIPRLEFFVRALRISRGNVSAILRRLRACLVIAENPQWCYGFLLLPPPAYAAANWRVPIRTEELEVIRQLELLERPPSLSSTLREMFAESSAGEGKPGRMSGTTTRVPGAADHSARGRRGVPDSGTGVPDSGTGPGVPESGTPLEVPETTGTSAGVPDSGTPHALMQQCKNALKEHSCIATCVPESGTPVPESGTGGEFPQVVRLTREEQELFDQLGAAGAFGPNLESRGCWFGMVQKRFTVTRELLGELRYARLTRKVGNPGGFMMEKWQRWGKPNV